MAKTLPGEWDAVEVMALTTPLPSCVLELRDTLAALSERVQALEAGQPKAGIDLSTAVIAGADGPAPVAGERSLMKAMDNALATLGIDADDEGIRAAILAVADWLEDKAGDLGSVQPEWWIAQMLRREMEG